MQLYDTLARFSDIIRFYEVVQYEVAGLHARRKARAKHSDKAFHFFRIGFPTVYVWRAGRCPAGSGTSPGPWPWHACALPVV